MQEKSFFYKLSTALTIALVINLILFLFDYRPSVCIIGTIARLLVGIKPGSPASWSHPYELRLKDAPWIAKVELDGQRYCDAVIWSTNHLLLPAKCCKSRQIHHSRLSVAFVGINGTKWVTKRVSLDGECRRSVSPGDDLAIWRTREQIDPIDVAPANLPAENYGYQRAVNRLRNVDPNFYLSTWSRFYPRLNVTYWSSNGARLLRSQRWFPIPLDKILEFSPKEGCMNCNATPKHFYVIPDRWNVTHEIHTGSILTMEKAGKTILVGIGVGRPKYPMPFYFSWLFHVRMGRIANIQQYHNWIVSAIALDNQKPKLSERKFNEEIMKCLKTSHRRSLIRTGDEDDLFTSNAMGCKATDGYTRLKEQSERDISIFGRAMKSNKKMFE